MFLKYMFIFVFSLFYPIGVIAAATDAVDVERIDSPFYGEPAMFLFRTLEESDKEAFENLRAVHNAQVETGFVERISDSLFDHQMKRLSTGNLWHLMGIFDEDRLVAAISLGRLPVIYTEEEHQPIKQLMVRYGIVDHHHGRLMTRNSKGECVGCGAATYALITDFSVQAEHLEGWHQWVYEYCCELAKRDCLLPFEDTKATHVMLVKRPASPDVDALFASGYVLYQDSEGNFNLPFYNNRETVVWVRPIES